MRKAKILPLIIVLAFFQVSCGDLLEILTGDDLDSLKEGEFYAQNLKTGKYYKVKAEPLAEGNDCVVWVEEGSGVSQAQAEEIASEYDNIIRPKVVNTFGKKNFYVNASGNEVNADFQGAKRPFKDILDYANWLAGRNDGKLTILLLDIKDTYKGEGTAYVAGYFASVNFLAGKNIINKTAHYANGRDMIYIDTNPGLQKAQKAAYTTFAHELQHLVNFVTTILLNRSSTMDTWIDEGLSAWAEYLYQEKNPVDKCEWFIRDGAGTIAKGNNFFVWDNHEDEPLAILDEYATVYLFFRWLYLQGAAQTPPLEDLFYKIITSPEFNQDAVTDVAKNINPEWDSWEKLLGAWLAANYNPRNTHYGYKGDPDLMAMRDEIPVKTLTGPSIWLYPGEGVYSGLDNSPFRPEAGGTNIRYAGLLSDPASAVIISEHSQSYTGNTLLTFNAGTRYDKDRPAGSRETGRLTDRSSILPRSLAGETKAFEFKGPYIIDARDVLGRNRDKDLFLSLPGLSGR
jgi:hypothetical protein